MAAHEGLLVLLLLLLLCSLLWIFSAAEGKEVTITCVSSEDCVLPCQFQSDGQGVRIMWYKKKSVVSCTRYGNTSFVVGHNSPADEYKRRTRLFADQVLKGNATLVLKNITPKDQGKYYCITYTKAHTEESAAVNVNVRVADVEVSCVFMESCILPCSFQPGPDVIIHWIQEEPRKTPVHSYYRNKDQLTAQGQRFRDRTSLFQDQISRGNASLRLTRVKVQDQGLYQCYTSNTAALKSFIHLKVDAPVREVCIQKTEYSLTCSSEGIYPEPELTWSTNPPSSITSITTTVQQTENQLYNIDSSLIPESLTDLDFICTVSTRKNWKSDTLFKPSVPMSSALDGYILFGAIGAILLVGIFTVCMVVHCKRNKAHKQMQKDSSSECCDRHIKRTEEMEWIGEFTYLGSEKCTD